MKAVVQRVKHAKLVVDNELIAEIGKGLVVFAGFKEGCEDENLDWIVNKISGLRIFEDENEKMNMSAKDIGGEFLIIPNFTLYADTKHGFRPSFIEAMNPEKSKPKFEEFVEKMRKAFDGKVASGIFGADMQITQQNDGPITIVIETENK